MATKEEISMVGFEIVAYAGDAQTDLLAALDAAREGDFEKAEQLHKDASDALPTILRCLEADKKKAKKVKEVVSNGQIKSGYYQLPQLKEDVNRFILFKTGKKDSATLIYIEGELDADDLITMLFMKKE